MEIEQAVGQELRACREKSNRGFQAEQLSIERLCATLRHLTTVQKWERTNA